MALPKFYFMPPGDRQERGPLEKEEEEPKDLTLRLLEEVPQIKWNYDYQRQMTMLQILCGHWRPEVWDGKFKTIAYTKEKAKKAHFLKMMAAKMHILPLASCWLPTPKNYGILSLKWQTRKTIIWICWLLWLKRSKSTLERFQRPCIGDIKGFVAKEPVGHIKSLTPKKFIILSRDSIEDTRLMHIDFFWSMS